MLPARTQRRVPQGANLPDLFDQFQRDFDTIVEQFFEPVLERSWSPTGVEIWEDDEKVHVVAEMPGIKPDDIDITLDNNVLTIRGEKRELYETPRQPAKEGEDVAEKRRQVRWHMRSRSYGQFMRQYQLPGSVDESKVHASFKDGLLYLDIEKHPEVKPKKIEVKAE